MEKTRQIYMKIKKIYPEPKTWHGRLKAKINNWIFYEIEYAKYLFGPADNPYFCSKWKRIRCRYKGHPNGSIYYNFSINATEPDDRCKDCGDYI